MTFFIGEFHPNEALASALSESSTARPQTGFAGPLETKQFDMRPV